MSLEMPLYNLLNVYLSRVHSSKQAKQKKEGDTMKRILFFLGTLLFLRAFFRRARRRREQQYD